MYKMIVATYQGLSDTSALRKELEAVGIAPDRVRISLDAEYRSDASEAGGAEAASGGIFDWLFGVPDDEISTYRSSAERGHTIVTVHADAAKAPAVEQVLERYEPVDVDDSSASAAPLAGKQRTRSHGGTGDRAETAVRTEAEPSERVPVVEEDIKVGKRAVERGGVRVRSYVIEQPFEELVRLRDETIRVERRPASSTAPVGPAAFKERSFEMRERDEEAVVEKSARVKEEVVVSKDVSERTEQVRDKVKRTQVDVESDREVEHAGEPGRRRQ